MRRHLTTRCLSTSAHFTSASRCTNITHTIYIYTDKPSRPKARVCVRGDDQLDKPTPSETYASTPGAAQVRVIFAHAAQHGRNLYKLDVSQAFTQSDEFAPHVHIYIYPPKGDAVFNGHA